MAENILAIQEQIAYNLEQLNYYELLYYDEYDLYVYWYGIYRECDSLKGKNPFASCKKRFGYTRNELHSKKDHYRVSSNAYGATITGIRKEIDRLQNELGQENEILSDLTELETVIASNNQQIAQNKRELSLSNFKIYVIPVVILALMFFGIYLLRKKGK
jgi:hypothetical protein